MVDSQAYGTTLRRIGWNTAWLGIARAVTQAQLAVFTILVARQLGTIEFGAYATITTIIAVANVATTFGTDTLLIRGIAADRESSQRAASQALALQLGFSITTIAALVLWTRLGGSGRGGISAGLTLYMFTLLPLSFFSVYTAVLRGFERMDFYLLLNLAVVTLQVGGSWILLTHFVSLNALLAWLLGVQVLAAVLAGTLCRRAGFGGFTLQGVSPGALKQMGRVAVPLAMIGILGIVYQRMGVLALSITATPDQVGWYAAGARVVEAAKLVHIAVLGALLPALSRPRDPASLALRPTVFRSAALFLLAVSGGIALLTIGWGKPFINFLYGVNFAPAGQVLQIQALSLVPYTISACFSVRAITQHREGFVMKTVLLAAIFSLVANLSLGSLLGASGAALAILGAESLQAAVFIFDWKFR
ncbi:MAG TPA: oligosaccharide flippase family protein [Anaerolineaceae bacterium]